MKERGGRGEGEGRERGGEGEGRERGEGRVMPTMLKSADLSIVGVAMAAFSISTLPSYKNETMAPLHVDTLTEL